MRPTFSALFALSAWQILSVAAQAGPDCMPNCASQRRNDFAGFQCANADDAACLCANEGFKTAYRECARGCQAPEGEIDSFLGNNFCTGQAPAADQPSSEPASEPSSTAPPQPETTAQPQSTSEPEPEPTQESSTVVKDEAPIETPAAETTSSEEAQSSTTLGPESTATEAEGETQTSSSIDAESTSSEKTSSAAGAGATSGVEEDDEKPEKEKEDGGLSNAAIIGIGVGAGAVALGLAGLLIFLCCRRKRANKDVRPFIEISKPMPAEGAGAYTGRRDPFAEKRGDVMEMQSNRYEDMLPRTEPRTVV